MTASDKLFFWLFQNQPDRILQLLPDLPADAGGYRFLALGVVQKSQTT